DNAIGCDFRERRKHVVADAVVEGEAKALASVLVGEVGLVRIGKRRLQQWIAGDGAVGVDEAKIWIELLESGPLDAAGVAQVDVDVVAESAADVDAREVAGVDVIRF